MTDRTTANCFYNHVVNTLHPYLSQSRWDRVRMSALRCTTSLLTFIFLIASTPLCAADDDPPLKITWEKIAAALDEHPIFAQHRERYSAAEERIDFEKEIPNPSLEIKFARGQSNETDNQTLEWSGEINMPLGWIMTRTHRTQIARLEAEEMNFETQVLRREVLGELRTIFWQLVYEQERVQTLKELNEQVQKLVESVQTRVTNGDARPMELTRIVVEKEKATAELAGAQGLLRTRRSELATWLGTRKPLYADASLAPPKTPRKVNAQTEILHHPKIQAAKRRLQFKHAQVSLEKKKRFPDMGIQLFAEHELDKNAIGGGLEIDLPLWNFNRGNIQRASFELTEMEYELEAIERKLIGQLVSAQSRCAGSTAQTTQFSDRVVPNVTKMVSKTERAYSLGEATLLEVIDARRTQLETNKQLLELQLQTRLNCGEVQAFVSEDAQ